LGWKLDTTVLGFDLEIWCQSRGLDLMTRRQSLGLELDFLGEVLITRRTNLNTTTLLTSANELFSFQ